MAVTAKEVHICLPINDRRRAMDFYTAVLDLEVVGSPTEDGVPEPLQLRLDDRTMLMLIPADGLGWVLGDRPLAPPEMSECLMGLSLDTEADIDRLLQRVSNAGGTVLSEPTMQEWGYTALWADLDGHAWQITTDGPVNTPAPDDTDVEIVT